MMIVFSCDAFLNTIGTGIAKKLTEGCEVVSFNLVLIQPPLNMVYSS